MKFTVNIEKRYAYIIISLLVLGVGIIAVNAFNEGTPSIVGHHINDVEGGARTSEATGYGIDLSTTIFEDWNEKNVVAGAVWADKVPDLIIKKKKHCLDVFSVIADYGTEDYGVVHCETDYIRSGCSGGIHGGDGNAIALPGNDNGCYLLGTFSSASKICINCITLDYK